MALPYFTNQTQSLEFMRGKERIFDASDPGTGKTRVAIEGYFERRLRGGGCALVLAPRSLLKAAWGNDVRKFAPSSTVSIAYAENRSAAFERPADFYITNHDAVKWLAKQPDEFFKRFDTLIIDEVGAFKHSTSDRSKALNKIKKHFQYRHVMNGTPSPNSITDLWNQVFVLDDGASLGPSFFAFRSAVCTPKQVGPSARMIQWRDKEGASDAVAKCMEPYTIRHKFEDCISIPENHTYTVPYDLPESQARVYREMKDAQVALLVPKDKLAAFALARSSGLSISQALSTVGVAIEAVNAATVTAKLLQIASGAVYQNSDEYHLINTARYELVLDMAETRPHTVVFFLWKHQKDFLVAEATKRGLSFGVIDGSVSDARRDETVDFFQKGLYRIVFAHPQSAAHGLTLTRGSATIWASPTYNLEHFQQGGRRIYRAGQTQKTETITVIAPGTIEEHVWEALQTKQVRMDELLLQL